jgi:hypothetical protein
VKITKNQLKELVQQSIEEMIEGGPGSGRKGGGDTTGGPSYANVPKGAKTSKDAKKMKKKKKSLGTSIASKFQKQIDKYNKARKQTPKGLKRVTKESKGKKTTVKEIKQWMKKLEENRYRKVVNADARRVAWLVNNNLAEDYDEMPKSIRKKWSEAKYGRERYLANEFIKHLESKQLSEGKLTEINLQKAKKLVKKFKIPVVKYKKGQFGPNDVVVKTKRGRLEIDKKAIDIFDKSGNHLETYDLDSKDVDKAFQHLKKISEGKLTENKLRTIIRNTIKEVVNGKKK